MRLASQLLGCLASQRIMLRENHGGGAGDAAHLVECLLNMHETPGSTHALPQVGVVAHTCNPSPWKVEVEDSEIQGYPAT